MNTRISRTPGVFLAVWLCLALGIFGLSSRNAWELLWQSAPSLHLPVAAAPPEPAPPAIDPVQPVSPPAAAPTPAPAAVAPPRPLPATATQHILSPQFDEGPQFTARFVFNGSIGLPKVSLQKEPPAWMVDVPGTWKRDFQETFLFTHALIRKVRVLPERNHARLKFYFTNRRTTTSPPPPPPLVRVEGDRVMVTIQGDKS